MEPGYGYAYRDLATDEQYVWAYRGKRGRVVADVHMHVNRRHLANQLRAPRVCPKAQELGWVLIHGYTRFAIRDHRHELGLCIVQN